MAATQKKVEIKKDGLTVIEVGLPAWKKFKKEWDAVKGSVPSLKGPIERVTRKVNDFWESIKEENPLKFPISLGTGHVEEIQAQLDRLAMKARKKETFDQKEKDFLDSLYRWIAVGGLRYWFVEASRLLWHYMEREGTDLEIGSYIYHSSVIVKYAMVEMKKAILEDIRSKGSIRNGGRIRSGDILKPVPRTLSEQEELGKVLADGALMAEQKNKRLKNADNRFHLEANCKVVSKSPLTINIEWLVKSEFDYDTFEEQEKNGVELITDLPLRNGAILRLHDGLSAHLVQLNLAKDFRHFSRWEEDWVDGT